MRNRPCRILTLLALILCILTGSAGSVYAFPELLEGGGPTLSEPIEATAVASLTAEPAQVEPVAQPLTYVIQSSDTLYQIAAAFGVTVDMLTEMNRISNPRALRIGQTLTIPTGSALPLPSGVDSTITKVLSATLTAYTAGYESTGKKPSDPAYGITYSGAKVKEGVTVAVDPNIIPLGSTLYIEGVGLRKAEDTGSAIRGKKIDVYIPDLDEARSFGVKSNVNVYVLKANAL